MPLPVSAADGFLHTASREGWGEDSRIRNLGPAGVRSAGHDRGPSLDDLQVFDEKHSDKREASERDTVARRNGEASALMWGLRRYLPFLDRRKTCSPVEQERRKPKGWFAKHAHIEHELAEAIARLERTADETTIMRIKEGGDRLSSALEDLGKK